MRISERDYLEHHGIKGQKHGVRRGPPYPLNSAQKSSNIGARPLKYHSKGSQFAKGFLLNLGANVLSMIIPGFGLAWNANVVRQSLKHNLDGKNYINKDGEIEKLSKVKKKKNKTDALIDVTEVNPYKNKSGGVNNCFCCTTTFEMRRRGYDVRARRRGMGTTTKEYEEYFEGVKFKNVNESRQSGESRQSWVNRSYNKLCSDIEKLPNGSRGFCAFTYEGSNSGHTISWEVKNKSVTFYDGQRGDTNVDKSMSLSKQDYLWGRLDNCKIKPEITQTCISRKDK